MSDENRIPSVGFGSKTDLEPSRSPRHLLPSHQPIKPSVECTPVLRVFPKHDVMNTTVDSYYIGEDLSEDISPPLVEQPEVDDIAPPFWTKVQFWIGVISVVVAGAVNPLISKQAFLLSAYQCDPDFECEEETYDGYLMVTLFKYMYLVALSFLFYFILDEQLLYKRGHRTQFSTREEIERSNTYPVSIYLRFAVPALIDTGFSMFYNTAIFYTRPSTVAVMGMLQILAAAVCDMIFSRRALTVGKVLGLATLLAGMSVYATGVTMISSSSDSTQLKAPLKGAIFAGVAAMCRGVHSSFQGRNMKKYRIPPLKMLFVESSYSLFIMILIICSIHLSGAKDFSKEFWGMCRNWRINLTLNAVGLGSFILNAGLTIVGTFVSGLFRMILSRVVIFFLWVIEIGLGWSPFTWMTFMGWMILLSGVVIYSGIHPKINDFAPWFFKPLLCCKCLIAPENTLLRNSMKNTSNKPVHEVESSSSEVELGRAIPTKSLADIEAIGNKF